MRRWDVDMGNAIEAQLRLGEDSVNEFKSVRMTGKRMGDLGVATDTWKT